MKLTYAVAVSNPVNFLRDCTFELCHTQTCVCLYKQLPLTFLRLQVCALQITDSPLNKEVTVIKLCV